MLIRKFPFSHTFCTGATFLVLLDEAFSVVNQFFHIPPNYVVEGVICSAKATRGENLQVEHPIYGGYASAFHFHATLARVLGSTLIRHQVVQVCQPRQKRPLAPVGMMKGFHHEQLPVDGVMRLVQEGAGHRHLRVFEDRIPTNGVSL